VEIEELLRVASDDEKDNLLTLYEQEMDALENQKKVFEDLEFQQLEVGISVFLTSWRLRLIQ